MGVWFARVELVKNKTMTPARKAAAKPKRLAPLRRSEAGVQAERQFTRDSITRGDAVEAAPDGTLPSSATHEVVGETAEGQPIIKRRRFSMS